jgi:hypothetical protein
MGWVHRHKHRGTVLALFALALQIAVTFGHVHLHGVNSNSHAPIAKQVRLTHSLPQTPAQTPSDDDDYCAICASIFLASSAFAPAPPQLLVPVNFERVELCFDTASPLADPPRLAFRSRAPPVA